MNVLHAARQRLSYDPVTGVFRWLQVRNSKLLGMVAGGRDRHGYLQIMIDGKMYKAHRLAWLFVHGEWPEGEIDHKNRVKWDNRIENLRVATSSENKTNTFRGQVSGFPGVYLEKRSMKSPYKTQIGYFDKRLGKSVAKHLGVFSTPEEAHEVYDLACQLVHGEFYRGRA